MCQRDQTVVYRKEKTWTVKCEIAISKLPIARLRGLEPLASSVTGTRSNQLSYSPTLTSLEANDILLQNHQK